MAITPNMLMDLPTVSVTLGPEWATQLNTAFTDRIDTHDHSSGKGVKVTPAGLNINADLSIASNHLNSINSSRYIDNTGTLSDPADIRSTYVVNGDLYYNNGAGAAVQITSGASVNSSSDGVSRSYESTAVNVNTTILPSDTFSILRVDTGGSVQVTLPAASGVSNGRFYVIKDVVGNASTNNVTIAPAGADTIDGDNANILIDSNYGEVCVVSDGVSEWSISSKKIAPKTSTDNGISRYDGASGYLQSSSVLIDDSDNILAPELVTQTGSNLASTSAPTANSMYPNSQCKAWAYITNGGGGSSTVVAGFNIDSASWSSGDLTVNFHTNMADANYAVIATIADSVSSSSDPASVQCDQANNATSSFILQATGRDGGLANWSNSSSVFLVVFGNQ